MNKYLNSKNFPAKTPEEEERLSSTLSDILRTDYKGSFFTLLGDYSAVFADSRKQEQWDEVHKRLLTLFKCGKDTSLNGPMIGVSMSLRDSDYFQATAEFFGKERSAVANIEWMASCWNVTFGNTGIWMGKTFEPVSKEVVAEKCENNAAALDVYDSEVTRIGRNYFRDPHNPSLLHLAGIPALTRLWNLRDRPVSTDVTGFDGVLLEENLELEKNIPYSKTGGQFLGNPGTSVVDEMNGKPVYQLNYRWPGLNPVYPMTRLIDELVQIDDGIYLGQLVMATKRYVLGSLKLSFLPGMGDRPIGEPYRPGRSPGGPRGYLKSFSKDDDGQALDYGYQNNGFFLMFDPAYAQEVYADGAFPQLRPHPGESGYIELGYDKQSPFHETQVMPSSLTGGSRLSREKDWESGWKDDAALARKFTSFCSEPSPKKSDRGDVREMLREGESILQMLKRIQAEISAQTKYEDHLKHFEQLNQLFRGGVAPRVENGVFQGVGKGFNTRFNGLEEREWYGRQERCTGFDYYHGATLNLHFGFSDTFRAGIDNKIEDSLFFPTSIAELLKTYRADPNFLNIVWANIGRFIFPWAGKSYEKISGRKLSMLLDESDDLRTRYPERVSQLHRYPASRPHYNLVKKNEAHYWKEESRYAKHLKGGGWDRGMSEEDKAFWSREAEEHWVFGNNIQDSRIVAADSVMRMLDMNYRIPDKPLLDLAEAGPSPFVRQGYIFLGVSDRQSILPMNNGEEENKRVFQFHYRYPMLGGPAPIGTCLDELVEIAEGLFLGQLIYSTVPFVPFHSSVDPADYKYQLFGYFLLMDNDWEYHRQAIKLDTLN